jgi:hypothetical protein
MEQVVKNLIKESLEKRVIGWEKIDPTLSNSALIDRWLTEIMALGYNDFNVELAARDIFELQQPLMGVLIPEKHLEDYRASVFLCNNRFLKKFLRFRNMLN